MDPPPAAQDFNLDNYRKFTQQEILLELNKEPKYTRFNLTKKERKAIKSLITNSDIIKPADKVGAIVIQYKCNYIAECQRQLSNETHYKKLTSDPTQELNNKFLEL